ncbi:MAG: hypothetical protein M3O50_14925 [Myxococcota bacterium]|nr:hypothetical protein [Myxococcota bacterium]
MSTSGAQMEVASGTVFSTDNGDILIPGTKMGVAQASWTPTRLQVGMPPTTGHLVASVACIASGCVGPNNPPYCPAVGIDPGSDYTIVSDLVTFA